MDPREELFLESLELEEYEPTDEEMEQMYEDHISEEYFKNHPSLSPSQRNSLHRRH